MQMGSTPFLKFEPIEICLTVELARFYNGLSMKPINNKQPSRFFRVGKYKCTQAYSTCAFLKRNDAKVLQLNVQLRLHFPN